MASPNLSHPCVLIAACSSPAYADVTKAGSGTDLADGASWVGSIAPGSADAAIWTGSSLGAGLTLGAPGTTWASIAVLGALTDINISGAGTLTNGNITLAGVNMTMNMTNWIGGVSGVTNTTWTVPSGKTLWVNQRVRGTNTLTFAGGGTVVITNSGSGGWTGGTIVSNNTTAIFFNTFPGGTSFSLTNSTLVFSNTINLGLTGGLITGSGTILKTGPAGTAPGDSIFRIDNSAMIVALNPGSLIDVEVGCIRCDDSNSRWITNYASAYVAAGAMLDAWDGYMQVDALNGYGTIGKGWSSTGNFYMGAANGSGSFYGILSNNFSGGNYGGAAGGTLNVGKIGTGTQSLYGTNTYIGSTVISNGTLVIAGAGALNGTANLSSITIPATGGTYNGNITLSNSAATFNYASSQYQTLGGLIAGPGNFTVSGTGSVTNTSSINIAGNATISGCRFACSERHGGK